MLNNGYLMEQDGRMHQQELLAAQQAQDLARVALSKGDEATGRRLPELRAFSGRIWRAVARMWTVPRSAWLIGIALLVGLLALAFVPRTAEAAHYDGSTGIGHIAVVTDDSGGDGRAAVVDTGSDAATFALDEGVIDAGVAAISNSSDATGQRHSKAHAATESAGGGILLAAIWTVALTYTIRRLHAQSGNALRAS